MFNLIKFFNKIKSLIGYKIYLLIACVAVVGIVEGIGVTLFFPVLKAGFGDDKLSRMLKAVFDFLHLEFSILLVLALIAVFFILKGVSLIAYARYFCKLSENLLIGLRRRTLERIYAADYLYILKKETGYMMNAFIREIAHVVEAFDTFAYVFNYAIFAAVYIALSLVVNFRLTWIILLLSPVLIIAMRKINRITNRTSFNLTISYGRLNSILVQALSKFKYLKSTFSHKSVTEIVDAENRNAASLAYLLSFLGNLTRDAFEPLLVLVIVALVFYHVAILQKDIGEIIFLSFLFLQISRQFINAQRNYRRFLSSIGSVETFDGFEKELEDNRENLNLDGETPDFTENIVFKNVTMVFPNGKKALDNINVFIRPNTVVAFVGHSGSGKSTIANLITGLLKPTSGKLFFGDISYDRLNLKALRENIGYVTQEDVIFNASVKDNILLWAENSNDAKLAKVIEMAHIKGFINGLPEKEDSMLGDNGLDISGGQRQRITIARELYKHTKLLILDEATSSLDSESERQIYNNLKEFKGKKTMVVIAHRLSTIKNADYIYVLDDGRVIEEGTFEELHSDKDTKFYSICHLQSV